MAWEIRNEDGDVTKTGGKLEESPREEELTDYSQVKPMPEPPHMKYDRG